MIVGPKVGSIVHVTTVTYAYRGRLAGESPSYLLLTEAVLVFETGPLSEYRRRKHGKHEEETAEHLFVSKGSVVAVELLA